MTDDLAARPATPSGRPNILYVHIDNLGMGELGCYGGGILRGADTVRLDRFASEGLQLLNFAPEAQCTPSRSALMTGRHPVRSGLARVQWPGVPGGLVAWEQTMGDILSAAGYATAVYGKWHIGDEPGRYPTDHGFDEWYGIPHSYDECLWPDDPLYDPDRDPMSFVVEGAKGGPVENREQLTMEVRRNIDAEYLRRADVFIRRAVAADTPFYVYFNHSLLHFPTVPRDEFAGKSGVGEWADCLLELDGDFGTLLDLLDDLGIAEDTIVTFAGDNGADDCLPWRGTSGFFDGSYFTGMEGSLRTPCLIRWTGHVPAGQLSNEIVHITDMFTTLLGWAGCQIPTDRVIDGVDQRPFFTGEQDKSNRQGFLFWNGEQLYGIKWQNLKMSLVEQRNFFDPAPPYANPRVTNLLVDPKEREPVEYPYMHTWVFFHFARLMAEFEDSVKREPPIPFGAPLDFVPGAAPAGN
ncbi:MAG TPA: sulfatase-like hydrolase/transferase [Mycobacterium sp.]|jgi:arylsulfatase A-like enzyme|nr:sulfatase-like hydrolase/transferase [Mycobacterium sp.]